MIDPAALVGIAFGAAALGTALGWVIGARLGARRSALAALADYAALQRKLDGLSAESARSARLLGGVHDAADLAILHLDGALDIVGANRSAREQFNLATDEHPSLMAAIRSAELRAVIDDARQGNVERQPVRIGDRLFAVRAAVLPDGDIVLVLADQTLLEYLERARRDLVANVSHDLRTPLTTLALLVDSLRATPDDGPDTSNGGPHMSSGGPHTSNAGSDTSNGGPDTAWTTASGTPDRSTLLAEMDLQLGRIRALADDLVQLNELESGRSLFRLVPEPVAEIVADASASVARLLADGNVALATNVPVGLCVLADRGPIVRALVNLLDNARRFSSDGSTITVEAAVLPDGEDVVIRVCDEGPGIPPRERQRIFERFYRGDRSRRGSGTGLGLAIAKHIVEGHGGRIWAEDAVSGGAAVCFTLLAGGDGAGV